MVLVESVVPEPSTSPGFSVYPDDSLSVTEDRNWAVPKIIKGQEYTQDSQGIGEDGEDSITVADGVMSGDTSSSFIAWSGAKRLSAMNRSAQEELMGKLKWTDDRPRVA